MSIRTGQVIVRDFLVKSGGSPVAADAAPTAKLVINGVDNAATVTVTDRTETLQGIVTTIYTATVTLPTLTEDDNVEIRRAALVGGFLSVDTVWSDTYATVRAKNTAGQELARAAEQAAIELAIGAFGDSIEWDDDPPHPYTLLFHVWIQKKIDHYAAYAYVPRTGGTLYFDFAAGNDTTGNGTQLTPYKTKAKANALMAANKAYLFKRGSTWAEDTELSDSGNANVLIGSYGDAQAVKPLFTNDGGTAEKSGVKLSGAGSVCQNIKCRDWGHGGNASVGYCFWSQSTGTDVNLFMQCDGEDGGHHNIGHASGQGGITVFIGCRAKYGKNPDWTPFVDYALLGGNELIMDDCVIEDGSASIPGTGEAIGVIRHGPTAAPFMGMMICRNLRVLAGDYPIIGPIQQTVESTPDLDPEVNDITESNYWEINTVMEQAEGQCADFVLTSGVRINCDYISQPSVSDTDGGSAINGNGKGWNVNITYVLDGSTTSLSSGNGPGILSIINGTSRAAVHQESCRFHFQNINPKIWAGIDYDAIYGGSTNLAGSTFRNCIWSADDSATRKSGAYAQLASAFPGVLGATFTTNALWNITNDGTSGGEGYSGSIYQGDAGLVQLTSEPLLWADPVSGGQLRGAGTVASIPLEYDRNLKPRSLTAPSIGPAEGGVHPASVATQITSLDGRIPAALGAEGGMISDLPESEIDSIWDLDDGIETSLTPRECLRLMAAATLGKVSGGGTGTERFRDFGDTKYRITATVDSNGNRSAITYDKT